MKGWSLLRSVRRKESTSQWSGRERLYLETEETSCPSTLPYPGATSSCQREEKGEMCCFPQQDWASLPVWFSLLRNWLWFVPCRLGSLLLSCQTHSKTGYPGLLPPPAFHWVKQEPLGSPCLGALSSKDEAGIHPLYWTSNTPFAWLGWCHMLLLVQVHSYTKARGISKSPYKQSLP